MKTAPILGVEREAARIAAAFGIPAWEEMGEVEELLKCDHARVSCLVQVAFLEILSVSVHGNEDSNCEMYRFQPKSQWYLYTRRSTVLMDNFMARGLYRLGFGDSPVLAPLPELSAHEKLELRLSMPREFWPKQWQGEGNRD